MKARKGWCLYVKEAFMLHDFVIKLGEDWCCCKCSKPLIPTSLDEKGEVLTVGCPRCHWTISKDNEIKFT